MPDPRFPPLVDHARAIPAFPAALALGVLAAVLLGASALHWVGFVILGRTTGGSGPALARSLVQRLKRPVGIILPTVGLEIALALLPIGDPLGNWLLHAVGIAITLAVAFLFVRLTYVVEDVILEHHRIDTATTCGRASCTPRSRSSGGSPSSRSVWWPPPSSS